MRDLDNNPQAQHAGLLRRLRESPGHRKRQARLQNLAMLWGGSIFRAPATLTPAVSDIEVVAAYIGDENMHVRLACLGALLCAGDMARFAKPELLRALGDHEVLVRLAAMRVVVALAGLGIFQERELEPSLEDSSWSVAMAAAQALADLSDTGRLTEFLLRHLPRENHESWLRAASALGARAAGLSDALERMQDDGGLSDHSRFMLQNLLQRLPRCEHCQSRSYLRAGNHGYVCERCSNRFWY